MIALIFLAFAFVLFLIAASTLVTEPPSKVRLIAAGLACCVAAELILRYLPK